MNVIFKILTKKSYKIKDNSITTESINPNSIRVSTNENYTSMSEWMNAVENIYYSPLMIFEDYTIGISLEKYIKNWGRQNDRKRKINRIYKNITRRLKVLQRKFNLQRLQQRQNRNNNSSSR